jgi:hypothetical protein
MSQVIVWQTVEGETIREAVTGPVRFSRNGVTSVATRPTAVSQPGRPDQPKLPRVVLTPVGPSSAALAVLLVADPEGGNLSRGDPLSGDPLSARGALPLDSPSINGIRISAGMHLLRHADRIEVTGLTYWISGELEVEATTYDPATHGEDVDCFLTKAPLSPGQLIKLCPGIPGVPCKLIYKAEAWDLAMRPGNGISCPNCGFTPDSAGWQPPPLQPKRNFDALRSLLPR